MGHPAMHVTWGANQLDHLEAEASMRELAAGPRPPRFRPLRGHSPWLSVRTGDYRINYKVENRDRIVIVAVIGHRREVYRHLDL